MSDRAVFVSRWGMGSASRNWDELGSDCGTGSEISGFDVCLAEISTFTFVSRSSLGLKSILKMPRLEPGTSRLRKHAKRVRLPSALHPRCPEHAHALYSGDRTFRGPRSPNAYTCIFIFILRLLRRVFTKFVSCI